MPSNLRLIRAELGDATPPTDSDLMQALAEDGDWRLVALTHLRGRLAAHLQGGTASKVTVPDVIAVETGSDFKAVLSALQAQIARLQGLYDAEQGDPTAGAATSTRLRRTVPR